MRELEHSLRRHRHRIAVVAAASSITYGELEARSGALAARIALAGLYDDVLLIICAGRTLELIIGIVTALRVGRPYAVVEPGDDAARQIQQLAVLARVLILSDDGRAKALDIACFSLLRTEESTRNGLDLPGTQEIPGNAIAYVLFTSGSTGKPKGVAVTQANIRHYAGAIRDKLRIPDGLRYAHVSTFAADLGNTSLFLSLLTGGSLHLVSDVCRKDPALLATYLASEGIQFLKLTPSHWNLVMQTPVELQRFRLSYLVLGGEPLTESLAAASLQSGLAAAVVNHYGPTETTIGVLAHVIDEEDVCDPPGASIPIGTPIGDTRILIETEDGRLHTRAATGELLIGGPSVAAGYYKDPKATERKFVTGQSPYPDTRFYRSGDVVRSDEHGRVTFIGRRDRQVKIRGFRVELDHVESALRAVAGVRDARVRTGAGPYSHQLTALLVAAEPDFPPHESTAAALRPREATDGERQRIQSTLRQILPEHMIPQHCFYIAQFPINANGKADGARVDALLEDAFTRLRESAVAASTAAPAESHARKDLLTQILKIWRDRLLAREVTPTDDFFSLGGNSIDAILMVSDLQRRGYSISAHEFFTRPTPAALVDLIENAGRRSDLPNTAVPSRDSSILGPAQQWFFRQHFPSPNHWNQALLFESSVGLDVRMLATALDMVHQLHPMLETRFFQRNNVWHAEHVRDAAADCLTHGMLADDGQTDADEAIAAQAEKLHLSIDIERGIIFKVHLFKRQSGRDCMLFIAHHLCVDAVSWRILLEDLAHLYTAELDGRRTALPPAQRSYWDWVHHLGIHRDRLLEARAYWERTVTMALQSSSSAGFGSSPPDNCEDDSQTVWFG
jgi:amino acid adenylation domain-containing protein